MRLNRTAHLLQNHVNCIKITYPINNENPLAVTKPFYREVCNHWMKRVCLAFSTNKTKSFRFTEGCSQTPHYKHYVNYLPQITQTLMFVAVQMPETQLKR